MSFPTFEEIPEDSPAWRVVIKTEARYLGHLVRVAAAWPAGSALPDSVRLGGLFFGHPRIVVDRGEFHAWVILDLSNVDHRKLLLEYPEYFARDLAKALELEEARQLERSNK